MATTWPQLSCRNTAHGGFHHRSSLAFTLIIGVGIMLELHVNIELIAETKTQDFNGRHDSSTVA